ncbi:MAG: Ig-like domain-containing protein [Nitrospirota bacterium]
MKNLKLYGLCILVFAVAVGIMSCGISEDNSTYTAITVSPKNIIVSGVASPGISTRQFSAFGTLDGAQIDLTKTGFIRWSSSNENVATISSAGLATLLTKGETTITATDTQVGISGTAYLNVQTSTPSSLNITPADPTRDLANKTQQFAASVVLLDTSAVDVTAFATWSSSNLSVATIANTPGIAGNGLATFSDTPGATTITATVTLTTAAGTTSTHTKTSILTTVIP